MEIKPDLKGAIIPQRIADWGIRNAEFNTPNSELITPNYSFS
jgi:hypothetical protein